MTSPSISEMIWFASRRLILIVGSAANSCASLITLSGLWPKLGRMTCMVLRSESIMISRRRWRRQRRFVTRKETASRRRERPIGSGSTMEGCGVRCAWTTPPFVPGRARGVRCARARARAAATGEQARGGECRISVYNLISGVVFRSTKLRSSVCACVCSLG